MKVRFLPAFAMIVMPLGSAYASTGAKEVPQEMVGRIIQKLQLCRGNGQQPIIASADGGHLAALAKELAPLRKGAVQFTDPTWKVQENVERELLPLLEPDSQSVRVFLSRSVAYQSTLARAVMSNKAHYRFYGPDPRWLTEEEREQARAPLRKLLQALEIASFSNLADGLLNPQGRNYERPLSPREESVLILIANGLRAKEIAEKLCLSPKTVDSHRAHIREKLGITAPSHYVIKAIQMGLIDAHNIKL